MLSKEKDEVRKMLSKEKKEVGKQKRSKESKKRNSLEAI
jgi:hypothetical protein